MVHASMVALMAALLFGTPNLSNCEPFELTILHINDHHSYVEGPSRPFNMNTTAVLAGLGINGSGINSVAIKYGGFPRIVTLMDQLAASEPNVLKLHAGDALTGTLWYSLFKGKADAGVMSKACFDAFALGNHEFDDGDDVLADFLEDLAAAGCGPQVAATCLCERVNVKCLRGFGIECPRVLCCSPCARIS